MLNSGLPWGVVLAAGVGVMMLNSGLPWGVVPVVQARFDNVEAHMGV